MPGTVSKLQAAEKDKCTYREAGMWFVFIQKDHTETYCSWNRPVIVIARQAAVSNRPMAKEAMWHGQAGPFVSFSCAAEQQVGKAKRANKTHTSLL